MEPICDSEFQNDISGPVIAHVQNRGSVENVLGWIASVFIGNRPEHIHDPDLRDCASKEVWTLVDASPDEESSIATSIDGEFVGVRVVVCDEVLGGALDQAMKIR